MTTNEPARNIRVEYDHLTNEEILLDTHAKSLSYANLALNVHSCLNMGNMMRTSHLCGCRKFVVFGRRRYDKRSAVGVANYIEIERVQGLKDTQLELTTQLTDTDYIFDPEIFVKYIQQNNYLPVFIEQTEDSIEANLENIKHIFNEATRQGQMPIFIYGNEHWGIPPNILNTRHQFPQSITLELKQMGALQSFNVSNACAIISYLIVLNH